MIREILSALGFLLLCTQTVWSVEVPQFLTFRESQGLSDNTVYCALQDRYGFVWFGTSDGLNCYDGTHNSVVRSFFGQVGAIRSNAIYTLLEEGDDIWMGGDYGIRVYHRRTGQSSRLIAMTRYGVTVNSTVTRLIHGSHARVWIATRGQGLFVYDPRSGRLYQDSRHGAFIEDLLADTDGRMWAVSNDGRLSAFAANGKFLGTAAIPGFVNNKMQLCLARTGRTLWVGCPQGLYGYDKATRRFSPLTLRHAEGFGNINAMLSLGRGGMLLATNRGLLVCRLSTGDCRPMAGGGQLSDNLIHALMRDAAGTLWVMTNNEGVSYLPDPDKGFLFEPMVYNGNRLIVHAFAETPDGRLWLGTSHGLFRPGSEPMPVAVRGQDIQCLTVFGHDVAAGSKQDGLTFIDGAGNEARFAYSPDKPYTLTSNNVQSLLVAHDGQLYVGTDWGLSRYDRATHNFYGYLQISSMTPVVSLAEDHRGLIWGATPASGLVRLDPRTKSVRIYTYRAGDPRSLPANKVTAVVCDRTGRLWVATSDGLCHYDASHDCFVQVDVKVQAINFVCEDREGNLWIAGSNGLLCYNEATGRQVLYDDLPIGWNRYEANHAAYCTRRGEILVGTEGGFFRFSARSLRGRSRRYRFYVTDITLAGADSQGGEAARLEPGGLLYVSREVELPYTDNSFTLHFASPRYGMDSHPLYEYRLQGYDHTWMTTANDRASYSHIPPGRYTFMLREAGAAEATTVTVVILPPWYRTTLAWAVYILLAMTGLWLVYRWSRRAMRRKYEGQLMKYKEEQEKLSFQQKIRFFIDLVHEIRTPLSLISLPLELLGKNPTGDDARRYVGIIRKNTDYLLGVTNHLLDFQKVESGKLELHRENVSMNRLIAAISDQFAGYDELRHITLTVTTPPGEVTTAMDADLIRKVLMNLMSNAHKYARSKINVSLTRVSAGTLRVAVADDGPGVPDREKEHIFDAYYQIGNDNVAHTLGTGLGLAFARSIAEAHGGRLYVADAQGGGAEFRLELPIVAMASGGSGQKAHAETGVVSAGAEGNAADNAASDNGTDGTADRRYTLMVVEDNADLLAIVVAEARKWYRVVKATNGKQALEQLQCNSVDVIVSDVMMPVMDGIELCHRVKCNINYSHIPVILLTAKTMVAAKEEGMEVGADVYMEKPFSMRQLHLQIDNLLHLRQQFYERMRQLDSRPDTGQDKDSAGTAQGMDGNRGMSSEDYTFLKTMNGYLDRHLPDEDFSIGDLADELNMSRSSFYRKAKAVTGMAPIDYTRTYRLDRAAGMLRRGMRVSEVMMEVGFTSSSYFAKCFKNQFGVLPKAFVQQNGPVPGGA